jgi:hypothetical protein
VEVGGIEAEEVEVVQRRQGSLARAIAHVGAGPLARARPGTPSPLNTHGQHHPPGLDESDEEEVETGGTHEIQKNL